MSWNKNSFEEAKKKAEQRLSCWIDDIKSREKQNDTGNQLTHQYPPKIEKIDWKNTKDGDNKKVTKKKKKNTEGNIVQLIKDSPYRKRSPVKSANINGNTPSSRRNSYSSHTSTSASSSAKENVTQHTEGKRTEESSSNSKSQSKNKNQDCMETPSFSGNTSITSNLDRNTGVGTGDDKAKGVVVSNNEFINMKKVTARVLVRQRSQNKKNSKERFLARRRQISGEDDENGPDSNAERMANFGDGAPEKISNGNKNARFRRSVRIVMTIIRFLKVVSQNVWKSIAYDNKLCGKVSKDVAKFDLAYYKATYSSEKMLTRLCKKLFSKPPSQRTDGDAKILMDAIYNMPFFKMYPKSLKADLVKTLYFDEYRQERVIFKQGGLGTHLYFIVTGNVDFIRMEMDRATGVKYVQLQRRLTSGSMFGELALANDCDRTCTAICQRNCQLLSVTKEVFNAILRSRWEADRKTRLDFLKDLKYFEDWTKSELDVCANLSESRVYEDNKLIFGDVYGLTSHVYLVKHGKCDIVKKVSVVRRQSPYQPPSLFLPNMAAGEQKFLDKPYGRKLRSCRSERHYLTMMTLHPGEYFGVGEDLRNTFIIAKGLTECILVNSSLFTINRRSNELKEMYEKRTERLLSNRELYRQFEISRRWCRFKVGLVKEIKRKRSIPNSTTLDDVPEAIRLHRGFRTSCFEELVLIVMLLYNM
ncbi:hypothetical protein ScPMuIL_009933 [Solemya velum]